MNKYGSRKGKVDWSCPEFLRAVARCALTDISLVETFVFSAAFSTFDQDVDGYICPEDMRGLASLFVPEKLSRDEDYMRSLIDRMDRNNDGMIAYEEFVQTIKETGEPDFFRSTTFSISQLFMYLKYCIHRYYDPVLKAAATLIGFVVYCMSFYFGIAAVFSCNYD